MALSASLSVGRLFQFERAGKGPIDAEHAVITSVNDPKVGLQWRLRSVHFSRTGSAALDVYVRIRTEPANREYLAEKLALGSGVLEGAWLPGDTDALYVPDEAEVSVQFAAAAEEEWHVLIIGEITSTSA